MEKLASENLMFSEVGHLPIIKDFAKKIALVETLDAMVDNEMAGGCRSGSRKKH